MALPVSSLRRLASDLVANARQSKDWNVQPLPKIETLIQRWILHAKQGPGPGTTIVRDFENALAKYTGRGHCIATITGTAALHVSLVALGVRPGKGVLMPVLGYVAMANAVKYTGAYPVLIDTDDDGMIGADIDLSAYEVEAAVLPHLYGYGGDFTALISPLRDRGIPVIEDACQALGTFQIQGGRSTHVGVQGDVTVISFARNKVLTTGQGGAVLTDNAELAARIRYLCGVAARSEGYGVTYDTVGYNYAMPGIAAILGDAAMSSGSFGAYLHERRGRYQKCCEYLDAEGFRTLPAREKILPNGWCVPVVMDSAEERDQLFSILQQEFNVHNPASVIRPGARPLHQTGAYQYPFVSFPAAEELSSRLLLIPCV